MDELQKLKDELNKIIQESKKIDTSPVNGDFWKERRKVHEFTKLFDRIEKLISINR